MYGTQISSIALEHINIFNDEVRLTSYNHLLLLSQGKKQHSRWSPSPALMDTRSSEMLWMSIRPTPTLVWLTLRRFMVDQTWWEVRLLAHVFTGPIFKLWLPAERTFVGSYALAKELYDEKRFQKAVSGPLAQVRVATGDGLFTARPGEHNWEIAHRILMPAFGPLSINSMFPGKPSIRYPVSSWILIATVQ